MTATDKAPIKNHVLIIKCVSHIAAKDKAPVKNQLSQHKADAWRNIFSFKPIHS